MAIHLVQLARGLERRVAVVEEPHLCCLSGVTSVYELAQDCIANSRSLTVTLGLLLRGETLSYDEVYAGTSDWHLLPPIDVPGSPSRMLVAGTGLTHLGSARERQAMHLAGQKEAAATESSDPPQTDSMRMFQWGVEGGRPADGSIGTAPEWFYKGDGSVVRAPFESLVSPGFAEDGGEEAELAGIYLIDQDGVPHRIGMANGNEFSDHKFEKRNYLNLAGSKLRNCSIGPELVVGGDFSNVGGQVRIEREGKVLWQRDIASGEQNMCHSLANLEHHHFKFAGHRQPGGVHVHFFGADALSFGDGIVLCEGDVAEVSFKNFGRPLRNPIHQETPSAQQIVVRSLQ